MATRAPESSSTRSSEPSIGVSIGRYKRQDQIGKGSFAIVYRGVHPDGGKLIAIKTVQHAQLKGKLRANLFSEIKIMRDSSHPHIVGLVDLLESTHHIHLVMEFCLLGDLATFVKKRDKLASHPVTADMVRRYPNPPGAGFNEVIVRHFAKQLASALQFLHARNLMHRDLKPQNLLLNPPYSWLKTEPPENQPFACSESSFRPAAGLDSLPFLKVADFGFARHLPTTTMAETLCGSPLYMAPEILRYEKYDAKADLWSVGTVLFELLTGKPPFRAANHVELLRRIERTMDRIRFPDEINVSADLKDIIRGLLKKMPTERLSWENYFNHPVIKNEIPGLVESDRPGATGASLTDREPPAVRDVATPAAPSEKRLSAPRRGSFRTPDDRASPDQPRFSTPPESMTPASRRPSMTQQRPHLPDRATAPCTVPGVRNDRDERRKSLQPPSPSNSTPRDSSDRERASQQRPTERTTREARDQAAQDVAFERDYVMVEKRAVEVNAFADELAASPHVQTGTRASPSSAAAMARRATTQAVPSLGKLGQPSNTNRAMQIALRPESAQQRRVSYDRRFTPSKTSAQSALAAALNMVNLRFVNNPFAPQLGNSPSPPQGYGPYPAFPAQPSAPLLLGDTPRDKVPVDEDHRVLSTMEDSATRSDVVYGFAEVKYKQLVPIAPSNDNPLRGREEPPDEDDGLTPDAVVSISEEALVLYLKALAILTNTINLAGTWWAHKTRQRDPAADLSVPPSTRGTSDPTSGSTGRDKAVSLPAVGARINSVVQWARNRFNECLEKSEFVSRRLLDAQQKLPLNREAASPSPSKIAVADSKAGEISFRSGVTAEKLMWERALDMSRAAAVNELVGEDLPGCEVSYLTAMRLLEAVLEQDGEDDKDAKRSGTRKKDSKDFDEVKGEEGVVEGGEVSGEDRQTVVKLIDQMRRRLADLSKKLTMQKANSRNASKDKDKERDKSRDEEKPKQVQHRRSGSSSSVANAEKMARVSSSPGRPKAPVLGASPR